MIKKTILALMITAASLGFSTTEAEEYNNQDYCHGGYYGDCHGYYNSESDGNGNYYGDRHHGYGWGRSGCWR